jgi:hypothetical protein
VGADGASNERAATPTHAARRRTLAAWKGREPIERDYAEPT